MYLLRTALALGALTVSVPAIAQGNRYGWDRSRAEGSRDGRGRDESRGERTAERGGERTDGRGEKGGDARVTPGNGGAPDGRIEARVGGGVFRPWERRDAPSMPEAQRDRRDDGRWNRRDDGRWDRRDDGRWDRRDEGRIVVRTPVIIDRRDPRYDRRYVPPGHRGGYRYGDWDFRRRDLVTITAWFHSLPPARLSAYGYYGPAYGGVRYVFRPGLYLSFAVFNQLSVLPWDIEEDLGELPWYLERRIYGNTVLVIDTRSRLIVDIFEIDY